MKRRLMFLFALLLFFGIGYSYAQTRVSGVILDEAGEPIIGATIQLKGTSQVTATNIEGKFGISAPADGTLVITYVGMQKKEVNVSPNLKVVLTADSRSLQEIVVTGVGAATDKRKVGISVESLSEKSLNKNLNRSLDGALAGKIAGAQITSTSGQPGQQASIILRGINTLSSTQPMVLIDGVEISTTSIANGTGNYSSRLSDIDLSNVDRIEVVQGAAAATIYGAQGANGVIQIFTKKGNKGDKPSIRYSSSISVDNALKGKFGFAKYHYFKTTADGYIDDGSGNPIAVDPETGYWSLPDETVTSSTINNVPYKEKTYDHLDQYFKKNVVTQNHSINVTGGTNTIDYSLGLSLYDQESVVHGGYKKYNLTSNIGTELFKGFTLRFNTQLINSNNTTGSVNNRNNIYSGFGSALTAPAFVDLNFKDTQGNPFVNYDENDNSVMPFYSQKFKSYRSRIYRAIQGINANYKINKFVELDYKYGVDHSRYDFENFTQNQMSTNTPGKGEDIDGKLTKDKVLETVQNSLLSAFLRFDFQKDFSFNLPVQSTTQISYDWRRKDFQRVSGVGTGYPVNPPFTLNTASSSVSSEYLSKFITFGYLVNQKFDYNNLLGASFGFRSDYSSAFGAGSKPFFFPRADVYFRLSELLKNDKIYDLKLRYAYGEAGIQPSPYDRIITTPSDFLGSGSYFYLPATSRNESLDVEVSKESEFGIDFGLNINNSGYFNNLKGSVVYWTKKTIGAIWDIETPPSTGATSIHDNGIDLKSNGLQISLDLEVMRKENFGWDLGLRFSNNKSLVKKIYNGKSITLGASGSGQTSLVEGKPIGAFYGVKPLSSISETNQSGERYIAEADANNYEVVNGMVVNKSSKTVQFTSENEMIGNANPDFSATFINTFNIYKKVNVSFQIDWVKGAQVYNQTRQWLYRDRVHPDFDKEVTIGGEKGAWVAYYNSLYNTNQSNKYFVEGGSYARLRDFSISYNFNSLVKNLKFIKDLNLTFSGKNLVTLTNYSGIDPEAVGLMATSDGNNASANNAVYRGIDLYSVPNMRSYIVSLNVQF
jgi:TonB-linked SusC/RagA family outer membrane protein